MFYREIMINGNIVYAQPEARKRMAGIFNLTGQKQIILYQLLKLHSVTQNTNHRITNVSLKFT